MIIANIHTTQAIFKNRGEDVLISNEEAEQNQSVVDEEAENLFQESLSLYPRRRKRIRKRSPM